MVVKCFRGAERDINHCLVVAEVREALSVHKNSAAKLVLSNSVYGSYLRGTLVKTIILKSETVLQLWKT
jgi:hypothetical protein